MYFLPEMPISKSKAVSKRQTFEQSRSDQTRPDQTSLAQYQTAVLFSGGRGGRKTNQAL
jgi:hypothetical protein